MISNRLQTNLTQKQQLSRSVLIVGDDSAILSLMSNAREDSAHHTDTVMGVAETLEFRDADMPNVLICNFARPQGEGRQLNDLIPKSFDCGTLVEHLDRLVAEQCGA